LLALDNGEGSQELGDFFKKIWDGRIIRKQLVHGNFFKKDIIASEIGKATDGLEGRILTVYGKGNYHHYTYGLCNSIAKKRSDDYAYIHVDRHTDSGYSKDKLDCASFTKNLLEEPRAKTLMFIGSDDDTGNNTSNDYALIHQKELVSDSKKECVRGELKKIEQKDVYCSFDLDVLEKSDMYTRFLQGKIVLKDLLQIISVIQDEKRIVSADVLGYCEVCLTFPGWATREMSLLTYAAVAAKIAGKDTKELEKLHAYLKEANNSWVSKNLPLYNSPKMMRKEFNRLTSRLRV